MKITFESVALKVLEVEKLSRIAKTPRDIFTYE